MFYKFIRGAIKIYLLLKYKIKVIGLENIPSGGAVIAANHYSNYDPVVLAVSCPRQVIFMAKAELFNGKIGKWFFTNAGMIPVKRGVADINAIKSSIKALKDGELLGIFIEGTRVKEGEDSEAKSGAAMLSVKAKKPVVPVNIEGTYKRFSTITVTYGKPIDLLEGREGKLKSEDYKELSNKILDTIRSLKREEIGDGNHSS